MSRRRQRQPSPNVTYWKTSLARFLPFRRYFQRAALLAPHVGYEREEGAGEEEREEERREGRVPLSDSRLEASAPHLENA